MTGVPGWKGDRANDELKWNRGQVLKRLLKAHGNSGHSQLTQRASDRSASRVNPAIALLLAAAIPARGAIRITPAHPESVQSAIIEAYQTGQRRIIIPPGTYRITPEGGGPHLEFHDMSDFEIDAGGVQLIFTDQTHGGIEFRNCRNVRFRGASIRYEVPPFTQGVIEAIASDGAWYDVRIEQGYPVNFQDPDYFPPQPVGYLFDPKTRWWKPGTYDLNAERIERLEPNLFRVYWNRPSGPSLHPVEPADLVAFRGKGPHNIAVIHCARMRITGVTIYNAASFAVWEAEGDGDNHYTISVKRGPPPPEARTGPLLSSTADAFHSANMRKGPVLEGCDFESMGDDGIAIHGTYSFVFEARENRLVINKSSFRPGDPLRLFDANGHPAGEAVVESVRPMEDFRNMKKSRRTTLSDNTEGPYFEIALDRPLRAEFDYLASSPAATGSGYALRNNTIRNHRARGMLLKADNGLVQANTIDGSTMGGIVLAPEFWWNEADYSRNVVIRSNVIRGVASAPEQPGAVLIAAMDAIGNTPVAGCGHQHIVLDGNRFEDLNGVNLFISSSCDIILKNNFFIRPQHAAVLDNGASPLVFVTEAQAVRFESNTISDLGRFNEMLVKTTTSAGVEGADRGLTIR